MINYFYLFQIVDSGL